MSDSYKNKDRLDNLVHSTLPQITQLHDLLGRQ